MLSEEVLFLDTMILINIGTLVVVIITLVVALLALRSSRWAGEMAAKREENQLEEQEEPLEIIRGLQQGLEWERQERQSLREELEHERQERLRAQRRAEQAEHKAMREATQQLRARMDDYLKEIGEEGTWPGSIRRVK